jgi:hypothetical protein
MCMPGNGNDTQFLKLKQTVDDSLCCAIICSFSVYKDTHKYGQVAMGVLNGLMNECMFKYTYIWIMGNVTDK